MTPKHEHRWLALCALLARPDPPELSRGYRYTCAGDPRRDPEVIKRDLATAYVAYRRQEWSDGDISGIVSVRRWPLRLVKRQA